MNAVARRPLEDIATIERDGIAATEIQRGTLYVGLEHIDSDGAFVGVEPVDAGELASNKFRFGPDHILFGKLRPYLKKTARPNFEGICSTDIVPVRPGPELDRDYLFHFLRHPKVVEQAVLRCAGANLPRLSPRDLARFEGPVPPLSEQRRIAGILDKADAIRRKRKEAIALTEELLRSAFLEMFGDPVTNPKSWPVKPLGELLQAPLRNGLSPASGGKFEAQVLTLSAITRGQFDASASKSGAFAVEPWEDVRVDARDFLICRGNGNVALVGSAAFPRESMKNMVFPDTMIAARIDQARVRPAFLNTIWKSPFIRRQVEAGARTTNGTFKINQTVVEGIEVILPPPAKQQVFADLEARVAKNAVHQRAAIEGAADLFDSLVARAFSGPLESSP